MRWWLKLLLSVAAFIFCGFMFKFFMVCKCKENPSHDQYVCYMIPHDMYIVVCGDMQITSRSFFTVDTGHLFFSFVISCVFGLFWVFLLLLRAMVRRSLGIIRSIRSR